ncbi:uncharacterized protein HMPREF1541_07734 [Cyphellophora europaea CBS 101466]|uniref:Copper acquisition factor BIM1-like domain-containing protein n=1 Tax=Cyphellophora europaea (strain CBS 101466) TaxID=1220924 RepID=W2RP59_CYPE1|nr:uncharacterized protein HMPREF1541_07734 [Cyphellophora europaea CBS 101466]ETN38110.1 hypothetical protein HMPREF1541_07734 [Cyphellophora europaea CBS 101466]
MPQGSIETKAARSPVALLWPPYRQGSDGKSTTAPCGSWNGELTRHQFPIGPYSVPIISANETWIAQLAISYAADPTSNDDFEPLYTDSFVNTKTKCVSVNSPGDVEPGMHATLQMRYHDSSDASSPMHYACSDIVFVSRKAATFTSPCSGPLSEEVEVAFHPPPVSKSGLPSHSFLGSILAFAALLVFAATARFYILPRLRQRRTAEGDETEMAKMIS